MARVLVIGAGAIGGLLAALLREAHHDVALVARPAQVDVIAQRVRSVLGKRPGYGSTWQSVERGRSVETQFLNGEIVRRGAARGVPTPVNERAVETLSTPFTLSTRPVSGGAGSGGPGGPGE